MPLRVYSYTELMLYWCSHTVNCTMLHGCPFMASTVQFSSACHSYTCQPYNELYRVRLFLDCHSVKVLLKSTIQYYSTHVYT